jgi:hypothetical protein
MGLAVPALCDAVASGVPDCGVELVGVPASEPESVGVGAVVFVTAGVLVTLGVGVFVGVAVALVGVTLIVDVARPVVALVDCVAGSVVA